MRETEFIVVINHEEQYSIWHRDRDLPPGWSRIDIPDVWMESYLLQSKDATRFDKETCLAFIDTVWVDIRPLSVRKSLQDRA